MQDNMKRQKQKQVVVVNDTEESNKKKEHRIVVWTQEEDDILREQVGIHGTENWGVIASKFKDKTTRQCRRRWFTYLNSDFKKGGWSPEEDMLLCEAQKLFGNRWTEISKVVPGRTDNAVKNRFSTLRKKRAKYEALAKENNTSYTNSNNKRVILQHGYVTDSASESSVPTKKMRRSHIPEVAERINYGDRSHKQNGVPISQQPRAPFAVLPQNSHNVNNLPDQHDICSMKFNGQNKLQGTFLKKDDPKINALMQQAELLSSLALKVDAENMDQSLENAWKVLQEFLKRTKESDVLRCKVPDLQLVDLGDWLEDLKSNSEGIQPCWRKFKSIQNTKFYEDYSFGLYSRQMELYEDSPGSSEYSTGSTLLPHLGADNSEHSLHQEIGTELKSIHIEDQKGCEQGVISNATLDQDIFAFNKDRMNKDGIVAGSSMTEFSSPLQVTPMFRSLAAGIPSPQFSESERNFLMKTLGMESPSLNTSANPSQPPLCKRALLQSL
ncbi:Transcription factor [Stylosanthes scabra]|uniref:Transcription factor n=1 Tax=Stylosanthes scabra TaxID=79078 RepID=A0ABU6UQ99_9FABA|nr:Transcription factor [Stylosanthes scabra]